MKVVRVTAIWIGGKIKVGDFFEDGGNLSF